MKKIAIVIGLLFIAIVAMAYLYFSKLNADRNTTDMALQAASSSSAIIFSFENEKGTTDLLKEQPVFSEILGKEKYQQLSAIKKHLLNLPAILLEMENQYIYLSLLPGKQQEIDFMCFTQIPGPIRPTQMLQIIKAGGTIVKATGALHQLTLPDSTVCYLAFKDQLAVLSNSQQQVVTFLAKEHPEKVNKFAEYIRTGNKFNKNSLAQLYLNFNTLPALLKNMITDKLPGAYGILNKQDAFASLVYNYSKNKVLFTGTTVVNNPHNYYNLFANLQPQKINITNILPANTATFTVFAIDSYLPWKKKLEDWMLAAKKDKKAAQLVKDINTKYHLNLDDIFPRYFNNQMITFQLSNAEKIGAINLTNGDKLTQLLIDLSSDYNEEIKSLNEADILYAYFGLPFENFKKPFYTILDNYMVFANSTSTLQAFLTSYKKNQLLINTSNYLNASNQLPANANISFYIDHTNADGLLRKNIYKPYYQQLNSSEGLKNYDSFTYQLIGDAGEFQTNILINKQPYILQKDSLAL